MSKRKTAAELRQEAEKHRALSAYLARRAEAEAENEVRTAYRKGVNRTLLAIFGCFLLVGTVVYMGSQLSASPKDEKEKEASTFISAPATSEFAKVSAKKSSQKPAPQIYQKTFSYRTQLDEAGKFYSITLTSLWPDALHPVQIWSSEDRQGVVELPLRFKEYGKEFDYEFRASDINFEFGGAVLLGLRHESGSIEYIELPSFVSDTGTLKARLFRTKKE